MWICELLSAHIHTEFCGQFTVHYCALHLMQLLLTAVKTSCLMCRSKDDPFMFYAALYFGQQTYIVTNDQLRDHSFVLGPVLSSRLMQWQRQRQITFTGSRFTGRLRFKVSFVLLNKDWF